MSVVNRINGTQSYVDHHMETIGEVFAQDYYVKIFLKIVESKNSTVEKILALDNADEICTFWNDFWFALPDNMSIRREPFFEVCDLAEGSGTI